MDRVNGTEYHKSSKGYLRQRGAQKAPLLVRKKGGYKGECIR